MTPIPGFPGGLAIAIPVSGFKTGGLAGSTSSVRCANYACSAVKFMAPASNTGKVYIGPDTSVIKEAGATDFVTGWEIAAGVSTEWFACTDMSSFSYICTNATDDLIWMALP